MPYFINTFRVPKPGHFTAVARGVEQSLGATGWSGSISVPIAPRMPANGSLAIIGTVAGFETADDVDAIVDGLFPDNMAGLAARDPLVSMCDHFNWTTSRIISPAINPVDGFVPKIIGRTTLVAKPGAAAALLDLLLEWREELDMPAKPIVSVPLGGLAGSIRVSTITESLQAYEDFGAQIAADPRSQKLAELVTGPPLRGVGRISFNHQP